MKYIFLRMWIPHLYGYYLVFKNGEPVCSLTRPMFERLLEFRKDRTIFKKHQRKIFEKYLGTEINNEFNIYEIDPSKSTIINEEIENDFIQAFYHYFGRVFQENSPIIDSDGDLGEILYNYFPTDDSFICADLGAGSGHYSIVLSKGVRTVYACDISNTRLVRQQLPRNVKVIECNIQELPFENNAFDFIMCNFSGARRQPIQSVGRINTNLEAKG